ncbi:MAG TPA: monofunctional biosynthetic peptidoglycan transglycosylase [Vicinamibacteria bacterium]|nr:monofunctional biosynthetic peptidoglycan transglycosylase [Vicinamibacteria bacterium]
MRLLARLLLLGVAAALVLGAYIFFGLPGRAEVRALARENPASTSVMRQRDREARDAGRTPRRAQSWVPLSKVSRHLVHAVLASEDQKFFGHEGVDWEAIEKAVQEDRKGWRLGRGGSTITQQLAKNLFFTTHRSLVRKAREVVAARWLEEDLTKRRILELYLNVIEWGDGVYGAQAAAQRYYGKPASALGADEAAGLAAMIPNPRRINPQVDRRRFARAQRRVVWLMANAGYLDRPGLGAAPPPEPAEEEDEEEEETPAEPEPSVAPPPETPSPAPPANVASPALPEAPPPTPEPTASPV